MDVQLSVIAGIEELGALLTVLVLEYIMISVHVCRGCTLMTMGSKSATATPARVASATKENFMVKAGFLFCGCDTAKIYSECI